MQVQDAEGLFNAQNQLALDHSKWTQPHFSTTFEDWKRVLGYPDEDATRLAFIQKMPSSSTRYGSQLHCLKLTCKQQSDKGVHEEKVTAGFIDFEVKLIKDSVSGNVREITIRSIIVRAQMRRQGCGKMLYQAMLKYLTPGELDIIRLCVVDINQAALCFYFKLGFKITRWSLRHMGADDRVKVVLLCMQKLNCRKSSATPICLQDMPHVFGEGVVGEIVNLVQTGGSGQEASKRACIEKYNPSTQTFTVVHTKQDKDSQPVSSDICVNDMYSHGFLSFDRSPSVQLNDSQSAWALQEINEGCPFADIGIQQKGADEANDMSPTKDVERHHVSETTAKSVKRARLEGPGKTHVHISHLKLRRTALNVFDEGKINIGLQLHELGFIVRDIAVASQAGVRTDDVILAVRGTSLICGHLGDVDKETYRQEARAKLKQAFGNKPGVVDIIVGPLEVLREQPLEDVCAGLSTILQRINAKPGFDVD